MHLHAQIQEFSSGGGGVQVSLTKKSADNVFLVLSLFYSSKANDQFQSNLSFFKVPEGSNIYQGVQRFPGGGGPIAYSL